MKNYSMKRFLCIVLSLSLLHTWPVYAASSQQWFDDNTVYIDSELYGFDHRIETYLFIGTDASGNEDAQGVEYHGAMADFLLFFVMDHTDDTYGAIQIDRNTMTSVRLLDEFGDEAEKRDMQICTAHWYGTDPEMSAENTVRAVEDLLGELEYINGYYVLNMHDIGRLNATVGGVEVTIEDEDMTSLDPAFVKGTTLTLTDEQAEKYIRARMTVGEGENTDRMRRQKMYLQNYYQKVRQRINTNPNFAQMLWNDLKDAAVTDMVGNDVSRIAEMIRSGENKGLYTIEGETKIGQALDDGVDHEEFYPSESSILEAMQDLFSLIYIDEDEDEDED